MPTLNDILTANGDYTPVSGYPVDDKYENDSPVINVYDRTIGEIVGDTSTSGENVSQYLTFRIPRHPDHYDLIENGTNIRILYRLEDDTGEDVVPVNVVANEDYIIFGWKIPLVVTVNPGVVTFIIHAYKSENNIITYHYKTLPKTYMILETMETDVVVPEIEMYNLAEAYARGTITDVFGQTRPVEEGDPGYHDNSKYYKELAGTSKIDAETAKNAAEAAQEAAETAQHAAEDARDQAVAIVGGEYVSYGQTQSLNDTQKNKARENIGATGPNGYYPNMTVGLSENFVGTGEPTRRVFDYDTAGGSADISDGNAEIEKMYGDTIVWNQRARVLPNGTGNGLAYSTDNGKISITGTVQGAPAYGQFPLTQDLNFKRDGSKYLILLSQTLDVGVSGYGHVSRNAFLFSLTTGTDWHGYIFMYVEEGETVSVSNLSVNIFDLTKMFGAGNEPSTVEEFKAMFPLDYYPYDEGTLLNVNPAGIKTVGFNAYDKATGKAVLIGGNQYQITGTYTSLSYSTGEVLAPDSTGCFTPTKTGELTVTGGGANTCVHLTWSGYRNGDYEDYWTRTRDINIQQYFPGGLKRAGTVYDEISKDKAIKRIGVVDLGTLDWGYVDSRAYFRTTDISTSIKKASSLSIVPNNICEKYIVKSWNALNTSEETAMTSDDTGYVQIKDPSYGTDAAAFKTAMSGVMLYYELAEPIETTITPPLNLLYQVSDFGTEQFLGAGATEPKTLPIIADIVYDVNYRDTIKNLPKNYAKVKGYYPDLYTGLADNLIDRKGNGTPQEISYRTSCGDDSITDDGNGIIQSIFGKTVVWNQRVPIPSTDKSKTENGITFTDNRDGSYTVNTSGATATTSFEIDNISIPKNHKVLLTGSFTNSSASTHRWFFSSAGTNTYFSRGDGVYNIEADTVKFYFQVLSGDTITTQTKQVQIFDLTQMFGAGNEPSTLDDPRIKWIKDYANEYPEYNSGELISYNGSGIKTVGFNQWDEEVESGYIASATGEEQADSSKIRMKNYMPILSNTTYYKKTPIAFWNVYFDVNKNYIGYGNSEQGVFTTPSNACYMRCGFETAYGTTYKNDICINLSWSGYRNGEYEPYWSRTLNLPISTYFPDGMKSAGSVRDELTKDKAVKRINTIISDGSGNEFSELSTATTADGTRYVAYLNKTFISDMLPVKDNFCLSDKFIWKNESLNNIHEGDFNSKGSHLRFVIPSSWNITTLEQFKTWLSNNPLTIQYEITTPIETTITPPLDFTYKVADFGTEESIAEGKSTPFIGIIKYSDDFTRALVNMPKNYDTTASLDALAASLSAMLTSALDGTVTITRGEYDPATKKYEWSCQFTKNQVN